ncbi:MAG: putative metal-binding motif-containing protein, partial [Fibrobacterota bacterium]
NAVEACNGTDDNCNGTIDDGFDVDGDGYTTCNGDCDDTRAGVNPGATETPYNGLNDDCNPLTKDDDLDGDGYPAATDCNDNNAGINPAATDIPYDGIDQDCSGSDFADVDGDGYNSTAVAGGTDCDDNNAAINPGAADAVCNGADENCSGTNDEQYVATTTNCGVGQCVTTGLLQCSLGVLVDNCAPLAPGVEGPANDPTCYDGLDNNCDGLTDDPNDPNCITVCEDKDGDGVGVGADCVGQTDCNDNNAAVRPGAVEVCNAIDDNCNGSIDEGFNLDGDGYTTCAGDCNDNNAGINPGAAEIPYDGIDQNCNGSDLKDVDGDGYNSTAVAGGTDCNDN